MFRFPIFRSSLTAFFIATSLLTWVSAEDEHEPLLFVGADSSPPVAFFNNDQPSGLLVELTAALAEISEQWRADILLLPWSRAQWQVEKGLADLFCTYPSQKRQEYALFTETPAFIWHYGNLVYRKDNPKAAQIKNASSFDDLKGLVMIGQYGSEWEADNVPAFIERELVSSQEDALKVLLRRGTGDFLIMSSLEATYFARSHGLDGAMAQQAVSFIPDSEIPFHFGISKKASGAAEKITALEQLVRGEAYQSRLQQLMTQYTNTEAQ